MASQKLIFTAVPKEAGAQGLVVSVFASPQLTPDGPTGVVGDFPDAKQWAQRINESTWKIETKDGLSAAARRITADADQAIWAALFPPDTPVRSFEFKDNGSRQMFGFPVRGVMNFLSDLYAEVAQNSPTELPPMVADKGGTGLDALLDVGSQVGGRKRNKVEAQLLERYSQTIENRDEAVEVRALPPDFDHTSIGFETRAAYDVYLANRFYERPETKLDQYADEPVNIPRPTVPDVDFHMGLTALGDYPDVMRRVGLVVDLLVDNLDLPPEGLLRVISEWRAGEVATTLFHPWTAYELDDRRFAARPLPGSDLKDGMLALEEANDEFGLETEFKTDFDLVQVDPDGAALKVTHTAVNLHRLDVVGPNRQAFDAPAEAGLPTMRSAGIAIVRSGRAFDVATRLAQMAGRAAQTSDDDVVHYADHLLRGYRLDVLALDAAEPRWRSLCRRVGTYTIRPEGSAPMTIETDAGGPIRDEGYVKAASTTSADADDSPLYLHETMFRWDGWSAVAARPGRTIYPYAQDSSGDDIDDHVAETVDRREPRLASPIKLETSFSPEPGSLPRLRFGRTYAIRARAVDLAGNSRPFDDDDAHASDRLFYARFEPLGPPTLVPRARFGEGESVERMVIRSDAGKTAAEYAADPAVIDALVGAQHTYSSTNDRHVVPPKTSQLMAETHGAFDGSVGTVPAAFGASGSPGDAYDIAIREAATIARDHKGDPLVGTQEIEGVPADGDGQPRGSYVVNSKDRFPLAYLPDVIARGVAFNGLTSEVETVSYTGTWPDLDPMIVRIAQRAGGTVDPAAFQEVFADEPALKWDDDKRVLTVPLAQGEIVSVRYSSMLDERDLELMGVWNRWVARDLQLAEQLREAAARGQHWMITPFRDLVLVHAVQRPVVPPGIIELAGPRNEGDTFARLQGRVGVHARSTGQIDIVARWTEPVDPVSEPTWKTIRGRAAAGSVRVPYEIGDGVHRFPFMLHKDRRPEEVRHEFGDTKHRWVNYRLLGTTRFPEYFAPAITSDAANITSEGAEFAVNIKSSARPLAPRVSYVVPSFKWTEPEDQAGEAWGRFRRSRIGGALRVWMQRPWFSSGEGELLGAVLWPRASENPPEVFKTLVSRFGVDPIWDAWISSPALSPSSFRDVASSDDGLALAETSQDQVGVVGFVPEYDDERKMWFCDIDMGPKAAASYYPFVRLALVRYQPDSIHKGVMLSPVVLAEYAQLVSNRHLEVTRMRDGSFDVSVWGPAPTGEIPNRVEVAIEEHDGTIPGDLGWKRVGDPVLLATGVPEPEWIAPYIPVERAELHRIVEGAAARFTRLSARSESLNLASPVAETNFPRIERAELGRLGLHDVGIDISDIRDVWPVIFFPGVETWSGNVKVSGGDDPKRLVVTEYEHYLTDAEVGKSDTDLVEPHIEGPYLDRVVYADIVEV